MTIQAVLWPSKLTRWSDIKRLLVCGSRTMTRLHMDLIRRELELLPKDCVIVHGAQGRFRLPRLDERRYMMYDGKIVESGADMLTDEVALELGVRTEPHPADWNRYGRRAGAIRNIEMCESGVQMCLAFWDGVSSGTYNCMTHAKHLSIPVREVRFTP